MSLSGGQETDGVSIEWCECGRWYRSESECAWCNPSFIFDRLKESLEKKPKPRKKKLTRKDLLYYEEMSSVDDD